MIISAVRHPASVEGHQIALSIVTRHGVDVPLMFVPAEPS
jgi:hypothetical protein